MSIKTAIEDGKLAIAVVNSSKNSSNISIVVECFCFKIHTAHCRIFFILKKTVIYHEITVGLV